MAAGDPQGWESLGLNDPTKYRAKITGYRRGQGAGVRGSDLIVITNRSNGNYDVYERTLLGDKIVYSYNASNNKTEPVNKSAYELYFTGDRSSQKTNLDKSVKKATLQLASNNVSGGSGSISTRDLNDLKNSPGYKSLGTNTQPSPPSPPAPPAGAQPVVAGSTPGGATGTQQNQATAAAGASGPVPLEVRPFQPTDNAGATVGQVTDPQSVKPPGPPSSPAILRYPLANLDAVAEDLGIAYDFIKIRIIDHIASLDLQNPDLTRDSITESVSKLNKTSHATIILPMQPSISSSNSVDWGSDSMNLFQLVGGGLLSRYFQSVGNSSPGNIGGALQDLLRNSMTSMGSLAGVAVDNKQAIATMLAGYLVGSPNLFKRGTGSVINPNMEMLFNGPRLRTFNFKFDMTPRSREESEQIRKIIKTFKKHMSSEKIPGNAFLKAPKLFMLEYIHNGNVRGINANAAQKNTHPYLNKFKACALTEFSVDYTPDGSYMTYAEDGSMTRYSIAMSFAEVEPVYSDDYDLSVDDMGY